MTMASSSDLMDLLGVSHDALAKAATLESELGTSPPPVLFGAGSLASSVVRRYRDLGFPSPLLVVDDKYFPPDESRGPVGTSIARLTEFLDRRDLPGSWDRRVLCSILQSRFNFAQANAQFSSGGFELLHSIWVRALNVPASESLVWSQELVLENQPSLLDLWHSLSDQQSVAVLRGQLRYRLIGDWRGVNEVVSEPFADLPFWLHEGRDWVLIDGGAYTGDSIDTMLERWPERWSRIVGVEPDESSFERLQSFDAGRYSEGAIVEAVWAAIGTSSGHVPFLNLGNQASRVAEGPGAPGSSMVPSVKLSELVTEFGVTGKTFVKLDIEGIEVDSVTEALGYLEKMQVVLAVSCYHRETDLLDLFQLLRATNCTLRLRQYGNDGTDLMMVADFRRA
jgi:FkbM family methyltransferase